MSCVKDSKNKWRFVTDSSKTGTSGKVSRMGNTTNLDFARWKEIFGDEALTGALLDRLTHRCHILEMNGDSYRFKESMRRKEKK